ncbi:MAG: hypothetical protein DRJ40_00190 [Thermoprotei archaeon]|nr:MAG: hypothetical protein DRJ40_00190 [Thermoprotei archaeon]
MSKVRELLQEARELLKRAEKELTEAIQKNDTLEMRDAAEKAWNAIVQATNALILHYTGKVPTSHYERRKLLRELEKKNTTIEQLGLLDRYMARFRILHGETFYEGIIDIEQLEIEMKKVHKYIQDIEELLKTV